MITRARAAVVETCVIAAAFALLEWALRHTLVEWIVARELRAFERAEAAAAAER